MISFRTILWTAALWASASAYTARHVTKMKLPSGEDDSPLVTSRLPHKLKNGRGTFLGFRNVKDLKPLESQVEPLMPDGGLSPCVIRVLGVGGGGCNAVRSTLV